MSKFPRNFVYPTGNVRLVKNQDEWDDAMRVTRNLLVFASATLAMIPIGLIILMAAI